MITPPGSDNLSMFDRPCEEGSLSSKRSRRERLGFDALRWDTRRNNHILEPFLVSEGHLRVFYDNSVYARIRVSQMEYDQSGLRFILAMALMEEMSTYIRMPAAWQKINFGEHLDI
jgi:hypothetical protein